MPQGLRILYSGRFYFKVTIITVSAGDKLNKNIEQMHRRLTGEKRSAWLVVNFSIPFKLFKRRNKEHNDQPTRTTVYPWAC